jgi:hypothetical protein
LPGSNDVPPSEFLAEPKPPPVPPIPRRPPSPSSDIPSSNTPSSFEIFRNLPPVQHQAAGLAAITAFPRAQAERVITPQPNRTDESPPGGSGPAASPETPPAPVQVPTQIASSQHQSLSPPPPVQIPPTSVQISSSPIQIPLAPVQFPPAAIQTQDRRPGSVYRPPTPTLLVERNFRSALGHSLLGARQVVASEFSMMLQPCPPSVSVDFGTFTHGLLSELTELVDVTVPGLDLDRVNLGRRVSLALD